MSATSSTTPAVFTRAIAAEVIEERKRQDVTWGEQNWPDGTSDQFRAVASDFREECDLAAITGHVTWVHILREEVYEALAETDPVKLRAELLQVAAVAVNWIEAIDRRVNT